MTSMHEHAIPVEHWRMAGDIGIQAGKIDAALSSIKRVADEVGGDEGAVIHVDAFCIRLALDSIVDLLYPKHTASTSSTVAQEGGAKVEVA